MDHSATFARHFARLVSLLMHDVANVDEQKMSLRALVTISKSGEVTLAGQDWQLLANDQPIAGALTGVQDVLSQMTAHAVARIRVGEEANAADLLGIARIIASQAHPNDGGAHVQQKVAALAPKKIDVVTLAPAPVATVTVSAAEAPTIASPIVEDDAAARATQQAAALLGQLTAPDVSKLTADDLFAALADAKSLEATTKVLDDIVLLAEHSARVGKAPVVGEILHGVVSRETALPDGELKRAYILAIRRLAKPALLRSVAAMIPKRPERKQHYYEILERTGEEGADALIEQITQASTSDDRRALLEVFRELTDSVTSLKRMLGDSRWFVVRNAADLLAELGATAAEDELIDLLRHTDDRVRRSATNALLRLGTPDAIRAIYEAVGDSSPEVRMQATAAISTRKDSRTSTTLIRAIEEEDDADVQLAMIAALGKIATPDAVQKLVKMAEPEARLFRKKTTNFRVAAVQALGEARTPAAIAALRALLDDKDRDVRDTATRAMAQANR